MVASHEVVHLRPGQWIKVLGLMSGVIARSIYLTTTWCIQRVHPTWPLLRSFAVAFVRQAGHLSHKQIRATTPPTGDQISEYCKDHKLALASVSFDSDLPGVPDAALHFINCSPEEPTPVVLLCHGGGYVNPIIKNGHIPYAIHCARSARGVKGRVALLEYTLAPALKYPGQLAQASAALRLLLQHRSPDQIIIAGDSAGGNMVLGLLAHLIQQHPKIPPIVLPKDSRLRAALLLSPWVSFETSAPSFRENTDTDYITFDGMGDFMTMWRPDTDHVWAQPLKGGPGFWAQDKLPVDKCLLTAGQWEVLRDQIIAISEEMGAVPAGTGADARVQFALGAEEVHVQGVFDEALGLHDSNMSRSVDDWLVCI